METWHSSISWRQPRKIYVSKVGPAVSLYALGGSAAQQIHQRVCSEFFPLLATCTTYGVTVDFVMNVCLLYSFNHDIL